LKYNIYTPEGAGALFAPFGILSQPVSDYCRY